MTDLPQCPELIKFWNFGAQRLDHVRCELRHEHLHDHYALREDVGNVIGATSDSRYVKARRGCCDQRCRQFGMEWDWEPSAPEHEHEYV